MMKPGSKDRTDTEIPIQLIAGRDGKAAFAVLPVEAFAALLEYARKGAAEEGRKRSDSPHASIPMAAYWKKLFETVSADKLQKEIASWQTMRNSLVHGINEDTEEAEDTAAYDAAKERAEESLPLAIVDRLIDGANPIKVFREYRGLTQRKLAAEIATTPAYLSQIETGRRQGSLKLLHRLAAALEVDLDDLV